MGARVSSFLCKVKSKAWSFASLECAARSVECRV